MKTWSQLVIFSASCQCVDSCGRRCFRVEMSESEDEVDILGDTPPASTINYSDPHGSSWLLDSSTAPSWCDNIQQDYGNIFDLPNNCLVSDDDQQPSTSSDVFSKWTDSEKQLLHEGIDIYDMDFQKLSNFMGSKSFSEIKMFIESDNGLNLRAKSNSNKNHIYKQLLTENDIPASIEEVISLVTTAETTIEKNYKNSHHLPKEGLKNNFSSVNTSVLTEKEETSHDSDELYIRSILRNNISSLNKKNSRGFSKNFKTNSKNKLIDKEDICNHNINLSPNKGKKSNTSYKKRLKNKNLKTKSTSDILKSNTGHSSSMHILTGSGQMLPLSEGEQVIKIEKKNLSDAESDIEIEIDDDSHVTEQKIPKNEFSVSGSTTQDLNSELSKAKYLDLLNYIQPTLESMSLPTEEFVIQDNTISDLEKALNPDFFKDRSMKTPERYLIIRSHMIKTWKEIRPQYLTKTIARNGLKNCGDVNSIGKVHSVLEQIGAINFGCDQTSYIRPLTNLIKKFENNDVIKTENQLLHNFVNDTVRQRKKKIIIDGDGGYTITHSENGEFYEAVPEPKPFRPKKKPTNLLFCRSFNSDMPAPYSVNLSLSTLILMDIHSYMSRAEVMGLLGGKFSIEENSISIKKYVPCESLENSGTHCDMCPVSQSRASDYLSQIDLETVGWYHSHPLFPPQPSSQDILSQADLQVAFSPRPFLAVIVSPFWPPGRTYSQYKCFITKQSSNDLNTAYEFKIKLYCDINDETDINNLLNEIENLHMQQNGSLAINLKTDVCRSTNLFYLKKCLSSITHHLHACIPKIKEELFEKVINGISKIFNTN